MTILPQTLLQILAPYLDLLFVWFSDQVYERMLRSQRKHLLVQIHESLDLQTMEAACEDYHHQIGPGAKPTHRVSILLRALLIKYLYNLSYRQVEAAIQTNLLMRWFIGYRLFDPVLDHSTLERFEVWLRRHQPRLLFDAVLTQIDQDFPTELRAAQIGDTFGMRANAAEESLIRLLRHTGTYLLRALKAESLQQYYQVVAGLDFGPLFGPPNEANFFYLSPEARRLRLESTVLALLDLSERVYASGPLEQLVQVQQRLQEVDKILKDEFNLQTGTNGQVERVELLPTEQRGSYRIGSATDPEASYRVHGDSRTLGYNIQLVASAEHGIIREIQAGTGAQPDQAGVAGLIEAQIEHNYPPPPKLIYDQAAGAGKTRAEVERVSQGQTQLVARIHTTATGERFGPQDFIFSDDGLALICKNGVPTKAHYRSANRDGDTYYWTAKKCQGCPLWSQCRSDKANPKGDRRVFVSDYREQVATARAYNLTKGYWNDIRLRPRIERIIAMLTRYDGARRAQSRGLRQADFQAKMCATARNLRTWIQLRLDEKHPHTHIAQPKQTA
jgi:IS5 family transposase